MNMFRKQTGSIQTWNLQIALSDRMADAASGSQDSWQETHLKQRPHGSNKSFGKDALAGGKGRKYVRLFAHELQG